VKRNLRRTRAAALGALLGVLGVLGTSLGVPASASPSRAASPRMIDGAPLPAGWPAGAPVVTATIPLYRHETTGKAGSSPDAIVVLTGYCSIAASIADRGYPWVEALGVAVCTNDTIIPSESWVFANTSQTLPYAVDGGFDVNPSTTLFEIDWNNSTAGIVGQRVLVWCATFEDDLGGVGSGCTGRAGPV